MAAGRLRRQRDDASRRRWIALVVAERGGARLVAGPRGAGKTTTLGALLWELPHEVRTILIEDTPELPAASLQSDGRDVQALRTASGDGPQSMRQRPCGPRSDSAKARSPLGRSAVRRPRPLRGDARRWRRRGRPRNDSRHGPNAVQVRLVSDLGVPSAWPCGPRRDAGSAHVARRVSASIAKSSLTVTCRFECSTSVTGRQRQQQAVWSGEQPSGGVTRRAR